MERSVNYDRSTAYSEFVRTMDTWIKTMVEMADSEHLIDLVKPKFAENIEANIHYYSKLSDESKSKGENEDAARYKIIEKAYRQLCK